MIIPDANILLYAWDSTSKFHGAAREWVEKTYSGAEQIGMPLQTIAAFLRVVTNPRLHGDRFTVDEAISIIDEWLSLPNLRLLRPGDQHWAILRTILHDSQVVGPLITDAQLAALVMEHNGTLYTTDGDFQKFRNLQWVNPLSVT